MTSNITVVDRGRGNWSYAPQDVERIDDMVAHASLIILVKQCADVLERHYPSWRWMLQPDEGGGVVNVSSQRINTKYCYTCHTRNLQNDPQLRGIVRAGGEYLERFGFRRVPYSYEEWRRREQALGQFIPDVTDAAPRTQREVRTHTIRTGYESGHVGIVTDANVPSALAQRFPC